MSANNKSVIRVELAGCTPLICSGLSNEALEKLINPKKKQPASQKSAREICREKLYRAEDGETLVLPTINLFLCLAAAGRKVKNGPALISMPEATTLFGLIRFLDPYTDVVPLTGIEQGWVIHEKRSRLKENGKTIAVKWVYPKFEKWGLSFEIEVDLDQVPEGTIRELFEVAGKFIGLGEFRPQKHASFGCFEVAKWEVLALVPRE